MNHDGTRDLSWWLISARATAIPRIIVRGLKLVGVIGLALGLIVGLVLVNVLVGGLVGELITGLILGHVIGLVLGLIVGLVLRFALAHRFSGSSPHRMAPKPWRSMVSRASLKFGLRFGLKLGLAGFAWVFFRVFIRAVLPGGGFKAGLGVALMVGLVFGLVGVLSGLLSGLFRPGTDDASPLSPLASWSGDRSVGLGVGLVVGLGLVVGIGLLVGLGPASRTEGLGLDLRLALLAGCIPGAITGGLMSSATVAASLAFAQISRRLHTPVRLMRFLEDARERNVLRTAGPVYQFRHARLQDRLAAQVKRTTDADTVDSPGPSVKH